MTIKSNPSPQNKRVSIILLQHNPLLQDIQKSSHGRAYVVGHSRLGGLLPQYLHVTLGQRLHEVAV